MTALLRRFIGLLGWAHPARTGAVIGAGVAILPALAAGVLLLGIGSMPNDPNTPATIRFEGVVLGGIGGFVILFIGTAIGTIIGAVMGGLRVLLGKVSSR